MASVLRSGRATILTYHAIDPGGAVIAVSRETLEWQMAVIAEMGYRGVSFAAAKAERDATGGWPERSVILTFDDGYESVHQDALPVLARHGFSATAYVVTDHVGVWNDWEPPPPRLGRQRTMTWSQIAELAAAGWEVGSHTRSHPDLRGLTADAVETEVSDARRALEDRLQREVASFAYPFGYVSAAAAAIVASEYQTACTTELRRAAAADPLHLLPRVDVYYLQRAAELRRLLTGDLDTYLTIRRWLRSLRAAVRR